jgi:hypothetical protein
VALLAIIATFLPTLEIDASGKNKDGNSGVMI